MKHLGSVILLLAAFGLALFFPPTGGHALGIGVLLFCAFVTWFSET